MKAIIFRKRHCFSQQKFSVLAIRFSQNDEPEITLNQGLPQNQENDEEELFELSEPDEMQAIGPGDFVTENE